MVLKYIQKRKSEINTPLVKILKDSPTVQYLCSVSIVTRIFTEGYLVKAADGKTTFVWEYLLKLDTICSILYHIHNSKSVMLLILEKIVFHLFGGVGRAHWVLM